MIIRRFMIVPPALPSGGHAEQLGRQAKEFSRLLLEAANMRVLRRIRLIHLLDGPWACWLHK
jgi:hypothetical protein